MKRYLLLLPLTISCANDITQPTRDTKPTLSTVNLSDNGPSSTSSRTYRVEGPTGHRNASDFSDWITWTIYDIPVDTVIDGAYDWTDDHQASFVNTNGKHTRMLGNGNFYYNRNGTTITVYFRVTTFTCGSVQIDLSNRTLNDLIFSLVLWYPLCLPPEPKKDCWSGLTPINRVYTTTFTTFIFRIEDGFSPEFAVASYYYGPNANNNNRWGVHLPQFLNDSIRKKDVTAGVYSINIPTPLYNQGDVVCGNYLPAIIDESNIEEFNKHVRMWSINTPDGINDWGMRFNRR